MPAYRSDAEAEIRDAVVAKLRLVRPDARIMHEVNLLNGQNRVDVMAVSRAEIIMVEIKSAKDKIDRLPDQIKAMRETSHIVIAALHRKFLPADHASTLYFARPEGIPYDVPVWWYPKAQDMAEAYHPTYEWRDPDIAQSLNRALPVDALSLLHRDEMKRLCNELGIGTHRTANMQSMEAALLWGATGRQMTLGICAALRRRTLCAEADDPQLDTA